MRNFTVACLIRKGQAQYYTGEGWDNNPNRGSLYAPANAENKLKELLPSNLTISIVYAIQDKNFDYYDGSKFVYLLTEAKFYTMSEVEATLAELKKF